LRNDVDASGTPPASRRSPALERGELADRRTILAAVTTHTQVELDVARWISEPYATLPSDRSALRSLRERLDRDGTCEIPGFLTPEARAQLKDEILMRESEARASTEGANRKAAIKGEALDQTIVGVLAKSTFMLDLVNGILGKFEDCGAVCVPPISREEIIPGVNIMRGPGDVTAFHFDGSYLNLIFPVVIPKIEGAKRGQLVIYPNARGFERSAWNRIVIPGLMRSRLTRKLFRRREIDYREDTIYLFYGARSLHGVESPQESGFRCITNMTIGKPRFA
jgi:hypothetical protein